MPQLILQVHMSECICSSLLKSSRSSPTALHVSLKSCQPCIVYVGCVKSLMPSVSFPSARITNTEHLAYLFNVFRANGKFRAGHAIWRERAVCYRKVNHFSCWVLSVFCICMLSAGISFLFCFYTYLIRGFRSCFVNKETLVTKAWPDFLLNVLLFLS